jgi:hypothetical protein
MHGQRMRYLSIVFGLALMVIVGGILAMIASQPPRNVPASPAAAVSPSPAVDGSPVPPTDALATILPAPVETPLAPTEQPTDVPTVQPTDAPTVQPTDVPTVQPTEQATAPPDGPASPDASPDASPELSPEPSPSPVAPTPTPAAPTREVAFSGVGLDSAQSIEDQATSPRFFTFSAEGPGVIRAQLSRVTGRVRACVWRGDARSRNEVSCRVMRRGDVERTIEGDGPQAWTVSLIGAQGNVSPSLDLRLTYPTNDAGIRLEGFRFQGSEIENYNGFTAELRAASTGPIRVSATLDDGEGGAHLYGLVIQEVAGGPAQPFIAENHSSSLDETTEGVAERSYRVTLENRQAVSETAVMLSAQLDWP